MTNLEKCNFWATVCKTVRPMLLDRCPVCLSMLKLGMPEGLGPGYIVLDGDPAPFPQRCTAPPFSAHICCGQMTEWIKMPLGTEVDLGPGDFVLDGDTTPPSRKRVKSRDVQNG